MFHHFKIIILFLFVTFTLSLKSEKLTIILVTAPKKRPELTKTINDLNNALKNIPNELDVSDIIFIKGCVNGCQHPELDYAIDLIKQNHPQIKITIPNFSPTIQDGLFFEEWMLDSLSSVWKRTSKLATDWSSHRYRKHMIINFYFINAMKYVYENINFDYLLLSEDDQTYKNDFFYSIVELIKTGSLDAFLDCLDFAPVGVIDLLKKYSVSIPLDNFEKRKALKEKTGFDVDLALKNIAAEKAEDEEKAEPAATRRVQPATETTTSGRRTAGTNYKVVIKFEITF